MNKNLIIEVNIGHQKVLEENSSILGNNSFILSASLKKYKNRDEEGVLISLDTAEELRKGIKEIVAYSLIEIEEYSDLCLLREEKEDQQTIKEKEDLLERTTFCSPYIKEYKGYKGTFKSDKEKTFMTLMNLEIEI